MLLYILLILRFLLTITRPYSYIFFDIIWKIIFGKKKMLPPVDDKILLMSATDLAEQIRKRKLSAEKVMKVYISRVKQVEPIINACVDERFEAALAEARDVDKMLQAGHVTEQQLETDTPLLGVPFSCKEKIGVRGLAQTDGLLFLKDRKASSDAKVVTELKKAGAIPFVATNVPTICLWWETSNLVFGRTVNPYDNRRTVGGSTGGEGALLASCGSVIGTGSDIAGSIRIPSAFCGVYGHKPTRGVISIEGDFPYVNKKMDPFVTIGPMCRYVEDLRMLVRIQSGDDARLQLAEKVDFSKVKIFYMEEFPGLLLSATSDVKSAIRKAIKHFQDSYGVTPVKVNLEEMKYAFDMWQSKILEADGPLIKKRLEKDGKINWHLELLKCMLRCAKFDFPIIISALVEMGKKDKSYYNLLKMYEDTRLKLEDILSGNSILLIPTHPEPAPHIWTTYLKLENIGYTGIFNSLGYPATNIPAGMSYGVPIGLQAISSQFKDNLTIAAAEELDSVFNGWKCPCEIKV